MRRFIPLLVLTALLASWPARGLAEGPRLYKNFIFGMSRQAIRTLPGVRDCPVDLGPESLCLDNQQFLGYDWNMGFSFLRGRLERVMLFGSFEPDKHLTIIKSIIERFELVALSSNDQILDLLFLLKHGTNEAEYRRLIDEFEKAGLGRGDILYTFIDRENCFKGALRAEHLTDLVAKADPDVRQVDYKIKQVGARIYASLWFSAPQARSKLMLEAPGKKEDF